jgi:hypothetical protein
VIEGQKSEVHSSPESRKALSDRWQESVSEIEDSGEDRWCTCHQVESKLC